MNLALTILYISTIAWVFPIFRQYRSNLFYFFLFLGICDPLTLIAVKIFPIKNELIAVIIAPILFYAINIDRKKPFIINKSEISVFVLAYSLLFIIKDYNIILLILHTLITIRVIYKNIIALHLNQKINLLHLVLAFYMISSVASLIIYLNGNLQGLVLFYINLAFQTLIAIFFSIFSEDNPKLTFKVVQAIDE
jgi:hypothetical protein